VNINTNCVQNVVCKSVITKYIDKGKLWAYMWLKHLLQAKSL